MFLSTTDLFGQNRYSHSEHEGIDVKRTSSNATSKSWVALTVLVVIVLGALKSAPGILKVSLDESMAMSISVPPSASNGS